MKIHDNNTYDEKKYEFLREFCDKDVWSVSKCNNAGDCLYNFYLTYIDKNLIVPRQNVYAEAGIVVHECLEFFYKDIYTREQMIENYIKNFNIVTKLKGLSFPHGESEEKAWYKSMLNFLQNHKKYECTGVELEKHISGLLATKAFAGFVDLIVYKENGHVDVLDWKTCSLGMLNKGKYEHSARQLALYKYVLQTEYGLTVDRCGWNMCKFAHLNYTNPKTGKTSKRSKVQRDQLIKNKLELLQKYYSNKMQFNADNFKFDPRKENWEVFSEYDNFNFNIEEYIEYADITEEIMAEAIQYVNDIAEKVAEYGDLEFAYAVPKIEDYFCAQLCNFGHECKFYKAWKADQNNK